MELFQGGNRTRRDLLRHSAAVLLTSASLTAADALTVAAPPKAPEPALVPVKDEPGLPRVLLIGDSISMGYTPIVRELLKGVANIHHPPENCGETARGLKQMTKWLGTEKWDVIHFNFGLHDLKYLDAAGKYVPPDQGKQVAPLPIYEANLKQVVARLKETGAHLIWASTTPVPSGSLGRVEHEEQGYNEAATRVMAEAKIPVDDLHAVVAARQSEMQLPHNVHFTAPGYHLLAESVVKSVRPVLVTDSGERKST